MKVSDLIELLQQYNQEIDVVVKEDIGYNSISVVDPLLVVPIDHNKEEFVDTAPNFLDDYEENDNGKLVVCLW